MKKTAKKRVRREEPNASSQLVLTPLATMVHQGLHEFIITMGMTALEEVLEGERTRLCGQAYARDQHGPRRSGSTRGNLVMGGRRVTVKRPRVREDGEEVALPSWQQWSSEDPLSDRAVEQMVIGVATRKYGRSLEEAPESVEASGTSKSAVSRRFVAATRKKLAAWLERDLSDLKLVAVMIDGLHVVKDHVVLCALGIDESAKKHVLGLWQGATENTVTCNGLMSELVNRGLDTTRSTLFVIDGSKPLRKAIRAAFGKRAVIQRCQEHKKRNVQGYLPKSMQPSVKQAMREAFRSKKVTTAKRLLTALANRLDADYPSAATSLREGFEEVLTVKAMQLPPSLERTLSTTNPIENLNGTIRRVQRRVTRWRNGEMVMRWTAAALHEAMRGFRRLRGHKGMPILIAALRARDAELDGVDVTQTGGQAA